MIRYDMTRQVGKGSAKSARLLIVPVSLLFFAAPVSESTLTDLTNYQASRSSACLPRLWLTPREPFLQTGQRGRKRDRNTCALPPPSPLPSPRSEKISLVDRFERGRRKEERADPINFARRDLTQRACAICVYSDNWKIFDLVSKSSSGRELNACVPKGGERFEKGSFLERVESK